MPISNAGAIMAAGASATPTSSSTYVVERDYQWIEVREAAESRQTSHAVEAPITEVPV